jgi:hypothetical protein
MSRTSRALRLFGEFLREGAVLVTVFVPLEAAAHGSLTARTVWFTVVLSGPTLVAGILLEVREK